MAGSVINKVLDGLRVVLQPSRRRQTAKTDFGTIMESGVSKGPEMVAGAVEVTEDAVTEEPAADLSAAQRETLASAEPAPAPFSSTEEQTDRLASPSGVRDEAGTRPLAGEDTVEELGAGRADIEDTLAFADGAAEKLAEMGALGDLGSLEAEGPGGGLLEGLAADDLTSMLDGGLDDPSAKLGAPGAPGIEDIIGADSGDGGGDDMTGRAAPTLRVDPRLATGGEWSGSDSMTDTTDSSGQQEITRSEKYEDAGGTLEIETKHSGGVTTQKVKHTDKETGETTEETSSDGEPGGSDDKDDTEGGEGTEEGSDSSGSDSSDESGQGAHAGRQDPASTPHPESGADGGLRGSSIPVPAREDPLQTDVRQTLINPGDPDSEVSTAERVVSFMAEDVAEARLSPYITPHPDAGEGEEIFDVGSDPLDINLHDTLVDPPDMVGGGLGGPDMLEGSEDDEGEFLDEG